MLPICVNAATLSWKSSSIFPVIVMLTKSLLAFAVDFWSKHIISWISVYILHLLFIRKLWHFVPFLHLSWLSTNSYIFLSSYSFHAMNWHHLNMEEVWGQCEPPIQSPGKIPVAKWLWCIQADLHSILNLTLNLNVSNYLTLIVARKCQ